MGRLKMLTLILLDEQLTLFKVGLFEAGQEWRA